MTLKINNSSSKIRVENYNEEMFIDLSGEHFGKVLSVTEHGFCETQVRVKNGSLKIFFIPKDVDTSKVDFGWWGDADVFDLSVQF